MRSVGYLPNTLENYAIRMETRKEIESEVLRVLTPRQIEVIEMRFGFTGIPLSTREIADKLNVNSNYIYAVEEKALRIIKNIILKHYTDVIDSKIGMTERHLCQIASSIANYLEYHAINTSNKRKRHGILEQWAKEVIMWRLTSDERQCLLWAYNLIPYPGKGISNYFNELRSIQDRILRLLLDDPLVVEKSKYKVKVLSPKKMKTSKLGK